MSKSIRVTWLSDITMIKEVLNELSKICRAEADRWYLEPLTGALLYMNVGERMALIHSEISEAFEGIAKTNRMTTYQIEKPVKLNWQMPLSVFWILQETMTWILAGHL